MSTAKVAKLIQFQAIDVFDSGQKVTIIYALDDAGQIWSRSEEVWKRVGSPFDASGAVATPAAIRPVDPITGVRGNGGE